MGRKSATRRLGVWMNGIAVGTWELKARGGSEFRYVDTWLASDRARPISLSMPLLPTTKPYSGVVVDAFFDNLLPDTKKVRERLQSKFHASSTGAFDLLTHIGRDCVGALQLLPEGMEPTDVHRIQGEALTNENVEQILEDCLTPHSRFAAGDGDDTDFRISLAGAQEKTALLKQSGQWARPIGPTPTTHILKLPIGTGNRGIDLSTSVENEWLCSRILFAFGLSVANSQIQTFGRHTVLEVERFDRELSEDGSWIMRLPQEDFCQVTGTAGSAKYESDGGPGIAEIMKRLVGSVVPDEDRTTFMRTQILFWLLCAIDGHAKNFSVFLLPESRFRLTPSYDVLSAYPVLGTSANQLSPKKVKMAMAVTGKNRHTTWSEFSRRHWDSTAEQCGLGAKINALLDEIKDRVPAVLEAVADEIPAGFPEPVADRILKGVRDCAAKL